MQVREKKNALCNQNKLKIAAFCINNYAIPTVSPQVTMPTIEEVVTVAKMADTAGFEGLVPICRWKGYIDERPNHPLNYVLDPFVLAGTLAHATRYSTLFTTLNTPTAHPVFVAKQAATIDRLSGGRFAMNIVGGWNRREFKMFGIDLLEHDERYRYMEEWLEVVRALWESAEEVNHKGKYFDVQGALCRPQPVQRRVPIMNAGLSPTGRAFAAQHSDIAFIALLGNEPENWIANCRFKPISPSYSVTPLRKRKPSTRIMSMNFATMTRSMAFWKPWGLKVASSLAPHNSR